MANVYTDAHVLQSLSESFDELSDTVRASASQQENMVAAMSSFWNDKAATRFQQRTTSHLQELNEVTRILAEVSNALANKAQAARVYLNDDY